MTMPGAVFTVCRPQFLVVGILFAVAYGAFAAGDWRRIGEFWAVIAAGGVLGAVSHAIGSQINCLRDRDLDRRYKTQLAAAVDRIGARRLALILALETVVGAGLALWVALAVSKPWLVLLWIIGWMLAMAYSVEPWRLKQRSFLNPLCLLTVIYILPLTFGYAALNNGVAPTMAMLASGVGAQLFALFLGNEIEDAPEDAAHGVMTPCARYGVEAIAVLSVWLIVLGAIPVIAGFWRWIEPGPGRVIFLVLYGGVLINILRDMMVLLGRAKKFGDAAVNRGAVRDGVEEFTGIRKIASRNKLHWVMFGFAVAIGAVLGL